MEDFNRDAYAMAKNQLLYYIKKRHLIAAAELSKEILKLRNKEPCSCQQRAVEVIYFSRTAYHWDDNGPDPNGGKAVCINCADHETGYWDNMWQEYYANCI